MSELPTPEWLAKHKAEFIEPKRDQETDRPAGKKLSRFEDLYRRGEIERRHVEASYKLEKHWHGSLGADVRFGGEGSSGPDAEYPRTYHAQMLAKARDVLYPRIWTALQGLILGATVEEVGRKWRAVGRREIARGQGLVLVIEGLEALSKHWGFQSK